MGSGSTIVGILLIFIFGIAGIYGLAMGILNGILPLWETVYAGLWLHAPPAADWFYYSFLELVLTFVLVPLWTWLCAAFIFAGAALTGNY